MKPIRHLAPLRKNCEYLRFALWPPSSDSNSHLWTWHHDESRQDPTKPLMFRLEEALKQDLDKC